VRWIGIRAARKPNPFGWPSAAAEKCEIQSSRVATRRSSYDGFWELDRGGRTVGERLGVRWPSTSGDGFGVALEHFVGARICPKGDGSGSDRERSTAAALLETRESSRSVMRVVF
jgi:hypothetical protein